MNIILYFLCHIEEKNVVEEEKCGWRGKNYGSSKIIHINEFLSHYYLIFIILLL